VDEEIVIGKQPVFVSGIWGTIVLPTEAELGIPVAMPTDKEARWTTIAGELVF